MHTPNSTYRTKLTRFGWLAALSISLGASNLPAQTTATQTTATPTTEQVTTTTTTTPDETLTLSPFEVTGTTEEDGYATRETNSSARVAQAYIDTSQTISVLNSAYIDDFNIQDTRKLIEQLPNTYSGSTDQNNRVWIRGSEVDSTYVDGVLNSTPLGGSAGTGTSGRPLQFYDRVELVSGPSSSAFGVGQPGGIINYLTKTPTGRTDSTLEVGYGTYQNYLANFDTEGTLKQTEFGNISYRVVGFWQQGNYQLQDEHHKGNGYMIALRDQINSTSTVTLNLQYSTSDFPSSDQDFILYSNQTAYSWLLEAIGGPDPGGGVPVLPGTKPYVAGSPNNVNGDWAGGQLLSPGTNGFPTNFGGFNDSQFRGELVMDKSFLDHALTVRSTTVLATESMDIQHFNWAGAMYIDPSTGQPFTTVFPENIGPIQDIGLIPNAVETRRTSEFRSENIDVDFHKVWEWVDFRFSFGGDANEYWLNTPEQLDYNITNPDGTPFYGIINTKYTIDTAQNPAVNTEADIASNYAYGFYANASAGFFKDRVILEGGNRADAGAAELQDQLRDRTTRSPLTHSKGAPRESIRIKPLPWLSFYALRAEHDDPPLLEQKYSLFIPGSKPGALAAINAKYNNFNNPFTVSPTGVLKEYGVKAEFLNGAIEFSADYFKFNTAGGLTSQVLSDGDPTSPTYQSQVVQYNLASSNAAGGEIEAAGRVTKHLTFTYSYGITRGRFANFADGNPNWIGGPTTMNLHFKYDTGWIHGFDFYVLGGAMRWGPFWDAQEPYVYYQTPQYVFDGGVGVRWDRGRQSLEASEDNIGGKIPFISPQTAYASSQELKQAFVKYKLKF